jgi:hypothetical protein
LLGPTPTDKNALRFWVLQRHNATHIRALVTKDRRCKIATESKNGYIRW